MNPETCKWRWATQKFVQTFYELPVSPFPDSNLIIGSVSDNFLENNAVMTKITRLHEHQRVKTNTFVKSSHVGQPLLLFSLDQTNKTASLCQICTLAPAVILLLFDKPYILAVLSFGNVAKSKKSGRISWICF